MMDEFKNCKCEYSPGDVTETVAVMNLLANGERELTYRIDFSGDLKVGGKKVPREQVADLLDDVLRVAFGDKLGIFFTRKTSGYANYVYKIWPDPDNYRGTFRGNQSITLNSRAPWSIGGIQQIGGHEVGHSWDFFGSGHNNGSFWSSITGERIRYSHMMNADDGVAPKYRRYPTFTSPEEVSRLKPRYGDHIPDPEPEPEPDPVKEELKKLRAERDELKAQRDLVDANLDHLRLKRDEYKAKLLSSNSNIRENVDARVEIASKLAIVNAKIAELK